MQDREEALCDLWSEEHVKPKPHSRLYHLKPIGVGSLMVESLTSYITRLAEAHSVYPRSLVKGEILALSFSFSLYRNYPLHHTWLTTLWRESAALNGLNKSTENWVQALEQLTQYSGLRFLTMLPYVDIFSFRTLLRKEKAWCPFCYEQWRNSNQAVYDPLLWNVSVIDMCPRHERPLRLKCPHCQQMQSQLAPRAFPGYCSQCSHWLGTPLNKDTNNPTDGIPDWRMWVEKVVGDLIAAPANTLLEPRREVITTTIREYVQKVAQGNILRTSRLLQAERRSIDAWLRGTSLFTLETFLRLCFQLRTTPLELLTGRTIITADIQQTPLNVPGKVKKQHRKFDAEQLQCALEEELHTTYDEPPSMREVAQRLNYNPSHLYSHFHELCRVISARYLNYQKEKKAERLRRLGDEVRRAVYAVHEQGRYPSISQVKKLLRSPRMLQEVEVYAVWRETLRELGWKQ